ncbi:MAG: hypothetical protein AAGM16_10495 [Pseudomonadota bacterium]
MSEPEGESKYGQSMILGMAMGLALGAALDKIPLGLIFGLARSVFLGVMRSEFGEQANDN